MSRQGRAAASDLPDLPLYIYCFPVYVPHVIRPFRDADTEKLFGGEPVRKFRAIERQALRKLAALDATPSLEVLALIPGNRLEKLRGDRQGQHSIRVNDQYRVCFAWREGDAWDVEIIDYH